MKGCELCSYPARMYCEADGASLCWDCDEKVHCANFIVAKHSRSLLCHVCQSPTPWKASGPKLGPTVSVCETCVDNCKGTEERGAEDDGESQGGNEHEEVDDLEDDDDDIDDEENDEDEDGEYSDVDEEDGENQVVPRSSTPPPPVATPSSSEEGSSCRFSAGGGGGVSALKRTREDADLDSDDDTGCFSSQFNHNVTSLLATSSPASENDEVSSSRPLKVRGTDEVIRSERVEDRGEADSRLDAIVSSLKRYQQSMSSGEDDASATIIGICKLSRDPRAVDLLPINPNHTV